MFLLQAVSAFVSKTGYKYLLYLLFVCVFRSGNFEKYPGRYFGRNPIMSGLVVALLVLLAYGSIYYKVASFLGKPLQPDR